MTPDERQMISGLFDRIRSQKDAQRDPQAETLISDSVRAQPYAPYLMAQTVLVQEQALSAAAARIKALEERVQSYESSQQQQQQPSGGFLGNIGRSLFGGAEPPPQRQFAPQPPPQSYAPQPNYQQPPAAGPWAQQPQQDSGGGGFMRGALGMAAGVAGGALLADGIRNLFSGHGGMGGFGGGFGGFGGGMAPNVENVFVEQPSGGDGGFYQADYPDPGISDAGYDGNYDSNDDYNV